jgi:predicted PurR-regulated permease PerM
MPPLDGRRAGTRAAVTRERWRVVLWSGASALVLYLVWGVRGALLPFGVGAILAYTLLPIVDRVVLLIPLRSPRRALARRALAVLLIYAAFGALLFLAGYLIAPVLADQVAQFVETLPDRIDAARLEVNDWLRTYHDRVPPEAQERIDGYTDDVANAAADTLTAAGRRSVALLTGTISMLFGFLVVPFWMFYALRDRYTAGRNMMAGVPPALRDDVTNVLALADRLLGRYIRGQLLLGVIVGVAVGTALTLMDVQLSLALGVWAGITELVPIIGPWLGGIPALIIVAGTAPDLLVPVLLVYIVVQQLENNFLVPRVQGQAVDIHPGMIILLLVVGGAAFGFIGLVVIVPLAAILRELFWYADRRLAGATPHEAIARASARARPTPTPVTPPPD